MRTGRQLTVALAAAQAGCNPETIRRAVRSHELLATRHPTKPGRPFIISAVDLAAWLEKRRLS